MIVYKLFRVMKDGSISSLFINKKERYPLNTWLQAKYYPTKGYSSRYGWHSCKEPIAPHLSMKGRAWFKCEIKLFSIISRPTSQGNSWYISQKIKIIEKI